MPKIIDRHRPLPIDIQTGTPAPRRVSFNVTSPHESRGRRPAAPLHKQEPPISLPPPLVSATIKHQSIHRHESDSSRHSKSNSLSTPLSITKKINHRRGGSAPTHTISIPDTPLPLAGTPKSGRRFSTPWSSSRSTPSPLPAPSPTPSPTSSDSSKQTPTRSSFVRRLSHPRSSSPSPSSLFRRRSARQSSPKPVLRTQPYGAPYFAPTPISIPSPVSKDPMYTSYLRGLPQFGDEIPSPLASVPDEYTDGSSESLGSIERTEFRLGRPTLKGRS